MINLSVFVERVNEYKEDGGYNVSSLARAIKLNRVTVSGFLNGAHSPSTQALVALADLFDCSTDYLLGLTDYPERSRFKSDKQFSECIRKYMDENHVTEYRLQIDLKVSSSLTYKWLKGTCLPSIESLAKISGYLGCTVDNLLGRG